MAKQQKQLQKRATNTQVQPYSGGIKLVGIESNRGIALPTFEVVVAAGGNSAVATLTSGNASLFEFIRLQFSDSRGNAGSGTYAGAPLALNITNVSKASTPTYPAITFEVVYKLKDGVSLEENNAADSYSVPFDAATIAAGITFDTADRLNSNDRGMEIDLTAAYTTGPDKLTVNIKAIAAIGLAFNVLQNGVSIGTISALNSAGEGQLIVAGTLAPGSYVIKAICTTQGAAFGSFAEVTVVV